MNRAIHLFACCLLLAAAALSACNNKTEVTDGSSYANRSKTYVAPPIVMPNKNPSLAEGKLLYERLNCAFCHGSDGTGVAGKTKANLTEVASNYRLTPSRMYQQLNYYLPKDGHPKLQLGNQQLWDLIFYVRSFSNAPLTAQQVAEIDPVFKANCAVCHGPAGFGDGTLAKNLNPQPANFHQFNRMLDRPDSMLYIHMRDGLYPSAMPPWKDYKDAVLGVTFDDAYRRKLVQYVRHFHQDLNGWTGAEYDAAKDEESTRNLN